MHAYKKEFIEMALAQNALKFGEFKLKSGRISPYFFNAGQLNSGQILKTIGECYAGAVIQSQIGFDVLFGPAYKGIPLACATAIGLAAHQRDVPYCFNRKEEKDHGEGGILIGAPLKGKVLIIDDVITAGTAIRHSFEIIRSADATPAGIIVALDRQERGQGKMSAIQEIETEFKVPVHAIITLADIMAFVEGNAEFAQYRQAMENYRTEYGI